MSCLRFLICLCFSTFAAAETIQTDLLIVGGTESGWAAAIQAARMGCKSVTIVHDGSWLGGQYTEQGLVCVDESKGSGKIGWGPDWHPMKRSFHRFGLFKELMDRTGTTATLTEATHERFREAGRRYGDGAGEMTVCKVIEDDAGIDLRVPGDWVNPWEVKHSG